MSSSKSPPYFLVPQRSPAVRPSSTTMSALSSTSSSTLPPPTSQFKAPAHKHAHHLHSIPPREKSTRTLIIDHMLWVHSRTRFAQARSELGMTDRSAGHPQRERPEQWEEDDEAASDGEEPSALKPRSIPEQPRQSELLLAKNLRARADGVEKVIASMLDQPPAVLPFQTPDHDLPSPDAPHPHTLPNGVRVRLALATVINDLFARDVPAASLTISPSTPGLPQGLQSISTIAHTATPTTSTSTSNTLPSLQSLTRSTSSSTDRLAPIRSSSTSKAFGLNPISRAEAHPPKRATGRARDLYDAGTPPSLSSPSPLCPRHLSADCPLCSSSRSLSITNTHTRSTRAHSNPNPQSTLSRPTYNSKQKQGVSGWRDGVGIGSGLAASVSSGSGVLRRRAATVSIGKDLGGGSGIMVEVRTKIADLLPRFVRLSALVAMELGREAREEKVEMEKEAFRRNEAYLASVAAAAAADEKKKEEEEEIAPVENAAVPTDDKDSTSKDKGKGKALDNTHITTSNLTQSPIATSSTSTTPISPSTTRALISPTPVQPASYSLLPRTTPYTNALRPTKAWYALLAGLLARAALEGYVCGGWRGAEAAECLLSIGLGSGLASGSKLTEGEEKEKEVGKGKAKAESVQPGLDGDVDVDVEMQDVDSEDRDEEDGEEEYVQFDPDDMPSLEDAAKVLFPSLRARSGLYVQREGAEADFKADMEERLHRFLDIPADTPDLAAHLDKLSKVYPVEPVERAAVRFCEAVAKWRGKPELEGYKKKVQQPVVAATPSSSSMSIDSLVHSTSAPPATSTTTPITPAPPKPRRQPIEKYFTQPPPPPPHRRDHRNPQGSWNASKRRRSPMRGEESVSKRVGRI